MLKDASIITTSLIEGGCHPVPIVTVKYCSQWDIVPQNTHESISLFYAIVCSHRWKVIVVVVVGVVVGVVGVGVAVVGVAVVDVQLVELASTKF